MLVVAVLTLYTSDPSSGTMRALIDQMKATGRLVFLKPLDQMPTKPKPRPRRVRVAPALKKGLQALPQN